MFKISSVPETYLTAVTVNVPDGSGAGKSVAHKFKAQFKRLTQGQLDDLNRRLSAEVKEGEERMTDDQLLDEVMVGWEDVLDENDRPADFTPDNFAALKDVYPTRATLVEAFFDSIKTAKRKN